MQKNSSIVLQIVDIDNLIQQLMIHEAPGGIIELVDGDKQITVRDKDGMKMFTLNKTIEEPR